MTRTKYYAEEALEGRRNPWGAWATINIGGAFNQNHRTGDHVIRDDEEESWGQPRQLVADVDSKVGDLTSRLNQQSTKPFVHSNETDPTPVTRRGNPPACLILLPMY